MVVGVIPTVVMMVHNSSCIVVVVLAAAVVVVVVCCSLFSVSRFHVSFQPLGCSIHKATNATHMLFFQQMHFLMFFIELLQFEGSGTFLATKIVFCLT